MSMRSSVPWKECAKKCKSNMIDSVGDEVLQPGVNHTRKVPTTVSYCASKMFLLSYRLRNQFLYYSSFWTALPSLRLLPTVLIVVDCTILAIR